MTDTGVSLLVQRCQKLRHLGLWHAPKVTDESLLQIATYLRRIRRLEIKACSVSNHGMSAIFGNCHELQQLLIQDCQHFSISVLACLRQLPKLRMLSVDNCEIRDETSIASLASAGLRMLSVSGCNGMNNQTYVVLSEMK